MEELGTTTSLKQARRLMEEIAANGHWVAVRRGPYSVVYSKGNEEMMIEKRDGRAWVILKKKKGV